MKRWGGPVWNCMNSGMCSLAIFSPERWTSFYSRSLPAQTHTAHTIYKWCWGIGEYFTAAIFKSWIIHGDVMYIPTACSMWEGGKISCIWYFIVQFAWKDSHPVTAFILRTGCRKLSDQLPAPFSFSHNSHLLKVLTHSATFFLQSHPDASCLHV